MVKTSIPILLVFSIACCAEPSASEWTDYRVGEVLREDVFAPSALVVINPEQTAKTKALEAAKIPDIYRHLTNVASEVETAFRGSFQATRGHFLRAHTSVFPNVPAKDAVASERFVALVNEFQKTNQGFPVDQDLAITWATGRPDRVLQAACAASLQETLAQPIVAEVALSPAAVRLIPAGVGLEISLTAATNSGTVISRGDLLTLEQARELLEQKLGNSGAPVAAYVGGFLRANCIPEPALTAKLKSLQVDHLWSADRYEAGDFIARRGQVIDARIKAALDQVRERGVIGRLQQQQHERTLQAKKETLFYRWSLAALAVGLAVAAGLLWRFSRRRRAASLVPAHPALRGYDGIMNVTVNGPEETVFGSPAAHLNALLRDQAVRALTDQRTEMLENQHHATEELSEQETRLEVLHARLRERLQSYEERISQLERELEASKGEESRESIRARIEVTLQQIKATRERLNLAAR